jgi:hypothetical protein
VCSEASSGSRRTNFEARSRMTTALVQRTLIVSFLKVGERWGERRGIRCSEEMLEAMTRGNREKEGKRERRETH